MNRRRLSWVTDPAFDAIEGKIVACRQQDEFRWGDVTLALESRVGEKVKNIFMEKGEELALELEQEWLGRDWIKSHDWDGDEDVRQIYWTRLDRIQCSRRGLEFPARSHWLSELRTQHSIHSFTHSFVQFFMLPIYSLTYSLTHSLTHSYFGRHPDWSHITHIHI